MKRKELRELIEAIQNLRNSADDETALASVYAYPEWRADTAYTVNERIRYGESLYRCVQAHTSQNGWEPTQTPALWTRVSLEKWPEWVQPAGAHDAYNTGDKVSYNGQHYICTSNGNIYAPGVYGWSLAE